MNTKKLTLLSMLLTFALVIFVLEAQLPPLAPIPGIKLGLANIITLLTLIWFGRREAFTVLILRIILAGIFTGSAASMIYSLSGGILCFIVMAVLRDVLGSKKIWVLSIFGAAAHNIAQLAAAVFVTSTVQVLWYLPLLLSSAIVTGAFTGLCAAAVLKRIPTIGGADKS